MKNENRHYLSTCTKPKSKWIKDPKIKPATLNLIEEKVGSTFECIGTENHFLYITPAAQTLRKTINKWDLLKLKSFCKVKDIVNKTKQQKDLHQPLIRQRSDLQNIQRTHKKLSADLNRELSTEEYKMAERHLRKCSTSFSHQRNANQNNSEISSYTCKNGQDQKH